VIVLGGKKDFVFKCSVGTKECPQFKNALCYYQEVWSRSKC